jgi:hypothetical protein
VEIRPPKAASELTKKLDTFDVRIPVYSEFSYGKIYLVTC